MGKSILKIDGDSAFNRLLDSLLGNLTSGEQVAKITEVLGEKKYNFDDKELERFIWSLKGELWYGAGGSVVFRKHLRQSLLKDLPPLKDFSKDGLLKNFTFLSDLPHVPNEKVLVALFKEIIEGWTSFYDSGPKIGKLEREEVQECFNYVCRIYLTVYNIEDKSPTPLREVKSYKYTKSLEEIFRNHLDQRWAYSEKPVSLIADWMCRNNVPSKLLRIMMNHQARYQSVDKIKEAAAFLAAAGK